MGGGFVTFLSDAFCNDQIKLQQGRSLALQCCEYAQNNFHTSNDGKLKREYVYIPSSDIIHANSPIDRIQTHSKKGITLFLSARVDSNSIKLRFGPCNCYECMSSGYTAECKLQDMCGKWENTTFQEMPEYHKLIEKSKEPTSNSSSSNSSSTNSTINNNGSSTASDNISSFHCKYKSFG